MCEYCNQEKEIKPQGLLNREFLRYCAITNNNGNYTFDFGITRPFMDLAVVEIKFCPICGEKLGD